MKQINLLPQTLQNSIGQKKIYAGLVMSLAIGLVTLGALWGFWYSEENTTKERLASIEAQKQEEARQAALATQGDADKSVLVARISQINAFSKAEVSWPTLFKVVSATIPKDVQLNSLSYAGAADGVTIKMGGNAPSNVSFAVFVESLNGNVDISGQKVESYSYDPKSGSVSFVVSYKVPLNKVTYASLK